MATDRNDESMSEVNIENAAAKCTQAAKELKAYPSERYEGRGIVICAGGYSYFTNAWVCIRTLRHVGCCLPIEVWYKGEDEMDDYMVSLLEPYQVSCIDANSVAKEEVGALERGYSLKPFSIIHSRFQHVFSIDADNVALRDPNEMFDSPEYQDTGALFWPDRLRHSNPAIWKILEIPEDKGPEFESGQLFVDKARCWEVLNLALWFNYHSKFFFQFVLGDKETFHLAFAKMGQCFQMPETPPELLTVSGGPRGDGVVCQHDFSGDRMFQHRIMLKWDLLGTNPRVAGCMLNGQCHLFLRELRKRWNGRVGFQRERLPEFEKHPVSGRTFLLSDPSDSPPSEGGKGYIPRTPYFAKHIEVTFESDGTIKNGVDPEMLFWDFLPEVEAKPTIYLGGVPGIHIKFECHGSQWVEAGRLAGTERRLLPVLELFPAARLDRVPGPNLKGNGGQRMAGAEISVVNSALGLGDAVTAVLACVGAANAGADIIFHTLYAEWFERISHPRLEVSPQAPVRSSKRAILDVHQDFFEQTRYGGTRARWYAKVIDRDIEPDRPMKIDGRLNESAFPFGPYVVIAPFTYKLGRNWSLANWLRLTYWIERDGFEVVVLGSDSQEYIITSAFAATNAKWVIGQPSAKVIDLMIGASAFIGSDSGLTHVAGLLGVPSVGLTAHLEPKFLWDCMDIHAVEPVASCRYCRWQYDSEYGAACESGCSALDQISPESVLDKFHSIRSQ